MTMQLRDGYRQLAPDASESHLEQAKELLDEARGEIRLLGYVARSLDRQKEELRERQADANIALAIASVGCASLLLCLTFGGWTAAAVELGFIGWLLAKRRKL
jgi:hypothetical protein